MPHLDCVHWPSATERQRERRLRRYAHGTIRTGGERWRPASSGGAHWHYLVEITNDNTLPRSVGRTEVHHTLSLCIFTAYAITAMHLWVQLRLASI